MSAMGLSHGALRLAVAFCLLAACLPTGNAWHARHLLQDCPADTCISQSLPNIATGVGFSYSDPSCLTEGGLGCVGVTGCRDCHTLPGEGSPSPLCPQCVCTFFGTTGCDTSATTPTAAPPPAPEVPVLAPEVSPPVETPPVGTPVPAPESPAPTPETLSPPPPPGPSTIETSILLSGPTGSLLPFDGTKQSAFLTSIAGTLNIPVENIQLLNITQLVPAARRLRRLQQDTSEQIALALRISTTTDQVQSLVDRINSAFDNAQATTSSGATVTLSVLEPPVITSGFPSSAPAPTPVANAAGSNGGGLSGGAIAGIAIGSTVGVLLLLALLAVLVLRCLRKRKRTTVPAYKSAHVQRITSTSLTPGNRSNSGIVADRVSKIPDSWAADDVSLSYPQSPAAQPAAPAVGKVFTPAPVAPPAASAAPAVIAPAPAAAAPAAPAPMTAAPVVLTPPPPPAPIVAAPKPSVAASLQSTKPAESAAITAAAVAAAAPVVATGVVAARSRRQDLATRAGNVKPIRVTDEGDDETDVPLAKPSPVPASIHDTYSPAAAMLTPDTTPSKPIRPLNVDAQDIVTPEMNLPRADVAAPIAAERIRPSPLSMSPLPPTPPVVPASSPSLDKSSSSRKYFTKTRLQQQSPEPVVATGAEPSDANYKILKFKASPSGPSTE